MQNEIQVNSKSDISRYVNIKALYLADTYGGFNTNNIPKQLHRVLL
jgi:hypothetical protein